METDKKPKYVWIAAVLFFVASILGTFAYLFHSSRDPIAETFNGLIKDLNTTLIVLGIYLFVSFVSALIANSNLRAKNWLGFGIPLLIIIPSAIHFFTCTGKFCNVIDVPIIFFSIIFVLLYILYRLISKWGAKFGLTIAFIEIALILCLAGYLLVNYSSDSKSVSTFNDTSVSGQAAVSLCEKEKNYGRIVNCWSQLVRIRQPETNICALTSTTNHYRSCFYNGLIKVYKDFESGNNNANLAKVCSNIAQETMDKYGIKDTDEFLSVGLPVEKIYAVRFSLEIILACGASQPYKDLQLISNAYSDNYKPHCEEVETPELKEKCLQRIEQMQNK